MRINTYLENLSSSLVLKDNEKQIVDNSLSTIKARLKNYFLKEIKDILVFGSYTRGTILPRKADEDSDIDIMVVFHNPDNFQPQTYLNKLKEFAENYYSSSEIHQSMPTIMLELNRIKFELVPAYDMFGMFYYIPDKAQKWMPTNIKEFDNSLVQCNKNNNFKIKPVIRLVKYWNIQKNNKDIPSYLLEKTIVDKLKFQFNYLQGLTLINYLKQSFESIRCLPNINIARIDKALRRLKQAVEYENNGAEYYAEKTIKEIFDEV